MGGAIKLNDIILRCTIASVIKIFTEWMCISMLFQESVVHCIQQSYYKNWSYCYHIFASLIMLGAILDMTICIDDIWINQSYKRIFILIIAKFVKIFHIFIQLDDSFVEINCIDKENDWEYQGSYYQDSCCYFSARIWTTFIVTSLIMVFESIICNLVMTIVLLLGNINQCINNIHCINEIRAFVNYTTIVGEIKYNTNMVSILLHNSAAFIVLNKHFVVKMVINNGKHKIWRIYRSWLYAHDPIIKTIRTIFMRIITIFIQLYFTVHGNLYRLSIFYILFYLLTKNEPEFMVV